MAHIFARRIPEYSLSVKQDNCKCVFVCSEDGTSAFLLNDEKSPKPIWSLTPLEEYAVIQLDVLGTPKTEPVAEAAASGDTLESII
jgi:hypothetical protein